jgi:hypothetical protein
MPKIDLTSHGSSVFLLCLFTVVFGSATTWVYLHGSPAALATLMAATFGNFSGALLLALKGSSGEAQPPALTLPPAPVPSNPADATTK